MNPREISIKDFTYELPTSRIATHPLADRDESKLLLYNQGSISEDIYRNLDQYIPSESLMIFNDSKVVPARLLFQKPSGGLIEIFCLGAHDHVDSQSAYSQKGKVIWKCLVGGASKWPHGKLIEKQFDYDGKKILLQAAFIESKADHFVLELSWTPSNYSFSEILQGAGATPLPPYIKREPEQSDKTRYQTIYADEEGSVAAPTAGLHFTDKLLNKLDEKKISREFVTLHVSLGTFKPVKSETIEGHLMHNEIFRVSAKTIRALIEHIDKPIIAVGTTSMRTIESLYWMGLKSMLDPGPDIFKQGLEQWDAYEWADRSIPVKDALESLLSLMEEKKMEELFSQTRLLIAPGYQHKIVNGLITNFHQPQSTLLLLVASFIGKDWKKVYQYALDNDFRFLSYGDGMLLGREGTS